MRVLLHTDMISFNVQRELRTVPPSCRYGVDSPGMNPVHLDMAFA